MAMKRRARAVRTRRRIKRARKYGRTMSRRSRVYRRPIAVKRTWWVEYWPFGVAATDNFWRFYQPAMSTCPNLAEYQALYDMYKVNRVKITLRPRWTGFDGADATTAGTTNKPLQNVHYIIDPMSQITRTGAYNSTTFNSFCENGNVKTVTANRPISIYYRPMHTEDAGGVTTGRKVGPRFMSLRDATAVTQDGVHIFLQDPNFSNAAAGWGYDVFYTFYFTLRGQR